MLNQIKFLTLMRIILFILVLSPTQYIQAVSYLKDIRTQLQHPQLSESEQLILKNQSEKIYAEIYSHSEVKMRYFDNPFLDPVSRTANLQPQSLEPFHFLVDLTKVALDLRDLHQSIIWPKPFSCFRSFVPVQFAKVQAEGQIKPVVSGFLTELIDDPKILEEIKVLLADVPVGAEVLTIDDLIFSEKLKQVAIYGAGSNESAFEFEAMWALSFYSHQRRELPIADYLKMEIKLPGSNTVSLVSLPYLTLKKENCDVPVANSQFMTLSKPINLNSFWGTRIHPQVEDFNSLIASLNKKLKKQIIEESPSPLIHDFKVMEEKSISHGLISGTASKQYAYLGIKSFSPELKISEVQALLIKYLQGIDKETSGLFIDVRNNGGGSYGDYLTQLFSKIPVESQTEELRASNTNREVIKIMYELYPEDEMLKNFSEAIQKAQASGNKFTERIPINKPEYLNSVGRVYNHPVIILTNPACYSYCDYFTSSMQDHGAAEVWIVNGKNTGGGGASVTSYDSFTELLPSEYPKLPRGVSYRIAFSNGYRTQNYRDMTIENNGAHADVEYWQSLEDIKYQDKDLWQKLIERMNQF